MLKIQATDKNTSARAGTLKTAHGMLKTPFFMPVATKGTVKFMDFQELEKTGTECIISNSLLMYLRPGLGIVKKAGGLHKFYGWKKGIFTDSGGFQSLDCFFMQKASYKGAYFRSPFDGQTQLVTPEKAMDIQLGLGSDVAMCLDDVPKYDDSLQKARSKTLRTHGWAKRCKEYHDQHKKKQMLFGIAQGGMFKDLREKSISFMKSLDFDGYALGGLAIGEPLSRMHSLIKSSIPHFPEDKPRYLMGVGSPDDLLECISMGVDCFDSTFPTQNARHSTLLTWKGRLRIDRKEYSDDFRPVDSSCDCYVCRNYSRAYIQHLLRANEAVGKKLATYHNVYFVQELIRKSREAILENRFDSFRKRFAGINRK